MSRRPGGYYHQPGHKSSGSRYQSRSERSQASRTGRELEQHERKPPTGPPCPFEPTSPFAIPSQGFLQASQPFPLLYNNQQQQHYLPINNQAPFNEHLQMNPLFQAAAPPQQALFEQAPPTNWLPCNQNDQPNALPAAALAGLHLPANQITEEGVIPTSPYYELPAGIMVPLVQPAKGHYQPIEPSKLRLPLPKFPDENFLRAIETFYAKDPTQRDNDGWTREYIDKFLAK